MKRWLLAIVLFVAAPAWAWAAVSVAVGTFDNSTSGATTTVSTSFQPKGLILWSWGKTSTGESTLASYSFGFSDGTTEKNTGWSGDNAVSTTNVGTRVDGGGAGLILVSGTPTQGTNTRITNVTFNATPNFVLTFEGTPSTAYKWNYIIVGGADITNVKVGEFTAATGTGNQSTTGIGFQPDMLMLMGARSTAGGSTAMAYHNMGFALSSSKQWALRSKVSDAQSSSGSVDSWAVIRDDQCYMISNTTEGVDALADFTQFTSDGFDLNWSDAAPSAYLIYYIAIKGGHWDAGVSTKPATATTQSVASLAYVPKLLGLLMSSPTALNTGTSTSITTFGATDGSNQVYAGAFHNDAVNTSALSSGSATALSHEMNATANATYTSFDSAGGWTVTWDAAGTAYKMPWFTVGDTAAGSPAPAGISLHHCTTP